MAVSLQAVILAAGKSSRFKTETSKLAYTLCGQEMILYPTLLLARLGIQTTVVVGHQKEQVRSIIEKKNIPVSFVEQHEQKGTGHAVLCTKDLWTADTILIMNGDMPLVTEEIIQELIKKHELTKATITFVTAHNTDPSQSGYGRVIQENNKISIVEARDFTGDSTQACCINAGIYLIKRAFLEKALTLIKPRTNTGELYITDLIQLANDGGFCVETISAPFDAIRGINTLKELWAAEHIKRSALIDYWMNNGVQFLAPQTVILDVDVTIGIGTVIGVGVRLKNGSKVGAFCSLEHSYTSASVFEDNVTILPYCVITNSVIQKNATIGPFAHVRNNSICKENSVIGNFVEVNKSVIGKASKAKHLSYLGNTTLGTEVNIGAGTITCNYDGVNKHETVIEDKVFVGSNTALVAPVTLGKESMIAAGSVITEDVPANALAIGRARQVTKKEYANHIRTRNSIKPFGLARKTDSENSITED